MSFGEYAFLPWLRRGIANQLQKPADSASRAALEVAVRLRSDAASLDVPPRSVLLIGPGDVIGVNPQMVLRTEPRAGVTNFETNYLAYVDFYDEDFAWRYTPDVPDAARHRLMPWVTLLVLKEQEFEAHDGRPLPVIALTAGADLAAMFPPVTQLWAWAHVHVNASMGSDGPPNLEILGGLLLQNPDLGYCRLMSPRRLEPNTRYRAFVIPTFEVGRLAGLGEPVPDAVPGLKIAWQSGRTFPVYYDWWFRTGEAGDFEDLVKALVPRDVDEHVGIREMDIRLPGFQLPATTGQPNQVVGLEGVLLAPTTKHLPVDPACDLPSSLAVDANAPADAQASGVPGTEDPLISIPLYGRWHALIDRVQPFAEHRNWINELNTDPRFRAVAGMGTKVIQANQEKYMQLAWEQIGDVLSLNRKIAFLQFSVKASDSLHARHLMTLETAQALAVTAPVMRKVLGSPVTVQTLVARSRLPRAALSGAMRKHLRARGQLARRTFGSLAVSAGSGKNALGGMIAGLNAGSLTTAAPRPAPDGATYERTLAGATPSLPGGLAWIARHRLILLALILVVALVAIASAASIGLIVIALTGAAGAVAAYLRLNPVVLALDTVAAFQPDALTAEAIRALPPNDAFSLPASGDTTARPTPTTAPSTAAPAGGTDSVQGAKFREAALRFNALVSDRPPPLPEVLPLTLDHIQARMTRVLRPAPAIAARYATTLSVGKRPFAQYTDDYHDVQVAPEEPRIAPVMAYPDIQLPMYVPLRDLQKDDFVPNLHLVPPDTISLMLTNPPVIESYMTGLNHEFARELLWREYPTDQRPSSFRQFWDMSHYVDTEHLSAFDLAERKRDIKRIHEWPLETVLGTHANRPHPDSTPRVVLIIRGDLLKRYPDTMIYAQRARWGDPPDHQDHLTLYDETGAKADADVADPNFRYSMFRAQVAPDITFIGFDLTLDDARGDPALEESSASRGSTEADRLGWFFVLQEVVGEPRFGLDEHKVTSSEDPLRWDNLAWENLGTSTAIIDLDKPFATQPLGSDTGGATWGSHAADMAFILYQKPVLVGIHARDMLKNL